MADSSPFGAAERMKRLPFGIRRKLRGNHHGGAEAHDPASAQFGGDSFAFYVPALASEHIGDLRHSRLRNNIRRHAGLVGGFLRGVGSMRREAMFGPVLTHWDEVAAYAVIGRLASALS